MANLRRNYLVIILPIFLAVILGIGGYFFSKYQYFLSTPVDASNDTNISFIIKKGENVNLIASNLSKKELILDENSFSMYLRLNGLDRNVVAGRFILNQTLSIPEIAQIITDPDRPELILTIPEGSTAIDVDEKLVEMGIIEQNEFNSAVKNFEDYGKYTFMDKDKMEGLAYPLEGYLFPDTYFIDAQNFHSENLIQLMLINFENKLSDELEKGLQRDLFEIITMASIIEKEVRTKEDIPIVSGILWKRLDQGWMLGADATLLYLKDSNKLDFEDLQADSPYNTRKNAGLPPGPISNPGIDALMGAIYPEDSPYYFYLTTLDTGEVIYAKSNEEHNLNKQKYLY